MCFLLFSEKNLTAFSISAAEIVLSRKSFSISENPLIYVLLFNFLKQLNRITESIPDILLLALLVLIIFIKFQHSFI